MWMIIILFFANVEGKRVYREERIAPDYFEGENLLYDCNAGHFVCAADSSLRNCDRRRTKSQEFDLKEWPCVSIKKTKDTIACHAEVALLVDSPIPKDFCYRKDFRHDLKKL